MMTSDQTALSRPDRNTILAALRYYQQRGLGDPAQRPTEIHAIATDGDEDSSLDAAGIDDLCDRLNRAGATGDLLLCAPGAGAAAIGQCTVSGSADPGLWVWILSDEDDDKREITLHATWPAAERAVAKVLENAMPEKPKSRAVFLAQLEAAGSDAHTILDIGGVSSADRIIVESAPVEP